MKTLTINLPATYEVPDCSNITPEMWEIMITSTYELSSIKSTNSTTDISKKLSEKYDSKLAQCKSKLTEKDATISKLNDELNKLKQSCESSYISKIEDITKQLTDKHEIQTARYRDEINAVQNELELIRMSCRKEINEKIARAKEANESELNERNLQVDKLKKETTQLQQDILEQRRAHLTELQTTLESSRISVRKELNEEYKEKTRHLENINAEDRKQLAQLQNKLEELRDTIRKELASEYKEKAQQLENIIAADRIQLAEHQNKLRDLHTSIKKELTSEYKNNLAETLTQELEKQKQLMTAQYNSEIQVLKLQNAQLTEKINHTEQTTNILEELRASINKVTGSGTNHEKGTAGESLIRSILSSDRYIDSLIEDVSSDTATGDLFFKWKQVKCLVEVKNKQKLTTEDITKFTRDVKESLSTARINCAMFVSIATDNFPGKSRLPVQFEQVAGIPVIYIYYTTPQDIHSSILYLDKFVSFGNTTDEQTTILVYNCKLYRKTLTDLLHDTEKNIKRRELELKHLKKEHIKYMDELDTLEKTFESNKLLLENTPDTQENTPDAPTLEEQPDDQTDPTEPPAEPVTLDLTDPETSQQIIKAWFIENNFNKKPITKDNLLVDFQITNTELNRLGGYTTLYTQAKNEYAAGILTDVVLGKITDYMTENKTFPDRNTLIPMLGSRSRYEKLGKAVRAKRTVDFIVEYYQAQTTDTEETNQPEETEESKPVQEPTEKKSKSIEPTKLLKKKSKATKITRVEEPSDPEN